VTGGRFDPGSGRPTEPHHGDSGGVLARVHEGRSAMADSNSRPPTGLVASFVRYSAVGLGSLATDLTAFAVLVHAFGAGPLVAHSISRPLGGFACWWLNRRFTFGSRAAVPGELLRFALVFAVSFALSAGLLALFCQQLAFAPLLGKTLAEGLAFLFNFFALRHFTYRGMRDA
jgi:putative flippase GtrA